MATDKGGDNAPKKKVARGAAKKVKDKWKAKQWYTIRAPKMYNGVPIAETLADETPKLMERVAEATLQDLSGDFSKMHVKLYFKVNSVKGTDCWTKFTGHELTSDYIRRLTRRKHSKVDTVVDVTTQDGWQVRVKPFAVTEKRAKSSQEAEIRRITQRIIQESARSKDIGGFVRELVSGDLAHNVYKEARLVYPLKRVEMRKSEVLAVPQGDVEELLMFNQPKEAPAEVPVEEAVAGEPAAEGAPAEGEAPAEATPELAEEERLDTAGSDGAAKSEEEQL